VSIGTVQYYCRSKDEMLQMAFDYVIGRIVGRATGVDGPGPTGTTAVGAVLRSGLLEFLPLDEERSVEARVYLAFAARAAVSAELARVQQTLMGEMRTLCAQAFALAAEQGQATTGLDPALAAAATVAIVDGLLLHMLTDPAGMPATTAVAVLDAHLRRYLELDGTPVPPEE
jgi:AcrR family transcriptional regulator